MEKVNAKNSTHIHNTFDKKKVKKDGDEKKGFLEDENDTQVSPFSFPSSGKVSK